MGVRVGKGVEVGMGVGVPRRGGTSVTAKLSPIVMMTSRLIIQNMMRFRRVLERRTVPPLGSCYLTFHYSTALGRHKQRIGSSYLKIVVTLLTMSPFRCIMTASQLMTAS